MDSLTVILADNQRYDFDSPSAIDFDILGTTLLFFATQLGVLNSSIDSDILILVEKLRDIKDG